ncbi:MAG: OsmC family protein [Promethearchaeota archaeon]
MMKNLVSDATKEAYIKRFEKMQKYQNIPEGDNLYLSKVTALSEQIENLHVKATIGDLVIENDGPKDLGGSGTIPGPMPMLLASIANCLEITALLYLSVSNLKINTLNVKVEAKYDKRASLDPKKEPFPGFFDFKYTWYINTEESLKKIDRILQKVEEICPVKGTFNKHHEFHRDIQLIKEGL